MTDHTDQPSTAPDAPAAIDAPAVVPEPSTATAPAATPADLPPPPVAAPTTDDAVEDGPAADAAPDGTNEPSPLQLFFEHLAAMRDQKARDELAKGRYVAMETKLRELNAEVKKLPLVGDDDRVAFRKDGAKSQQGTYTDPLTNDRWTVKVSQSISTKFDVEKQDALLSMIPTLDPSQAALVESIFPVTYTATLTREQAEWLRTQSQGQIAIKESIGFDAKALEDVAPEWQAWAAGYVTQTPGKIGYAITHKPAPKDDA